MDVIKDISELENRDIIISLPRDKNWLDYLSYFMELKVDNQNFNVIVDSLPKSIPGNRCHIICDGILRGSMEIYKFRETEDNEICIELIPVLRSSSHKIKMQDIIGFKYYYDNFDMQ